MAFKSNIDRALLAAEMEMKEWGSYTPDHGLSKRVFLAHSYGSWDSVVPPTGTNAQTITRSKDGLFEYLLVDGTLQIAHVGSLKATVKFRAHARNVKTTAQSMGLAYWPALLKKTVDPAAYIAAEKVLIPIYGEYSSTNYGGWDSQGCSGISSYDVDGYWWLSGCKATSKFQWLVRNHAWLKWVSRKYVGKIVTKGTPVSHLEEIKRGLGWLHNATTRYGNLADTESNWCILPSPKVLRALGKLPPHLRWAAITGVDFDGMGRYKPIRVRDLNWVAVASVQNKEVGRDHYVHPKIKKWKSWYANFKPLLEHGVNLQEWFTQMGAPDIRTSGVNPKVIIDLLTSEGDMSLNMLIPAWNLSIMFGKNVTAMKSFIAWKGSVHDAGQLQLPPTRIAVCWGGWLAAKPTLYSKTFLFGEAEKYLGGPPASLEEAVRGVTAVSPPPGTDEVDRMSPHERLAYEHLIPQVKTWEAIPAPYVENGQYTLVQLAAGDIRAPMAGRLTDCCQHLHGAAASCAALSYTSPHVAIWAVFKGDVMVAQSLLWKSRSDRALVLDSVESLGNVRNNKTIAEMFITASRQVLGKLGVSKVLVSQTDYGMTETVRSCLTDHVTYADRPTEAVTLGYSDAGHRLVVLARTTPVKDIENLPQPEVVGGVVAGSPCINELSEGSDVVCEHCNAEVHPLACTCPVCGQDISEWVD